MEIYPWLVLAHVLGGFGFVLGHGVSAHVAFRLRAEREPARIAALLDLSSYSLAVVYGSLLLLLVAGIAAGFVGGHWGRLWIWVSIGLLVAVMGVMYAIASPYYGDLRRGLGQRVYGDKPDAPPSAPFPTEELVARLQSPRCFWLAGVGGIGLSTIILLMVFKPF